MYTPQISACCLAFAPGKPKAFRNRERSYGWKNVCDGFSPLFWLIVQPGMADAFQKHMLSAFAREPVQVPSLHAASDHPPQNRHGTFPAGPCTRGESVAACVHEPY